MSYKKLCFTPLLAVVLELSVGCKPQEPVYSTDKDLGEGAQVLLPTDMHLAYDARLTQGKANDPDLSQFVLKPEVKPATGEAEQNAEQEKADQDEPAAIDPAIQALVERHNELLQAKKYDEAVQLYKEQHRDAAALGFRLLDKSFRLADAISKQSPAGSMIKSGIEATAKMKLVATKPEGENRIIGSLAVSVPGAPPVPPMPHVFERVGEQWFYVDQVGLTEDKLPAVMQIGKEAEAQLDALLSGLADGSVDAQSALMRLAQQLGMMQMKVQQIIQSSGAAPSPAVPPTPPQVPSQPAEGDRDAEEEPTAKDKAADEEEQEKAGEDQEEEGDD